MRKISLIAAMTKDRVIGKNNQLLWHLPNDLKHFKALTMAKPIVMGRRTFESIGRPLPGRQNIVLSLQTDLSLPGCEIAHSIEEMFDLAQNAPEIMVVGGEKIYQLFYPMAETIYLTLVHADFEGDAYFVPIEEDKWVETAREQHFKDEKHLFDYTFITLERQANANFSQDNR